MTRTVLVLLVVILPLLPSVAVRAAEDPAKWEKSYGRAIKEYVRKGSSLADWCVKHNLEGSAWTLRQTLLRWAPEEQELLEHLGYRKSPSGEWLQDPNSREKLRKVWDTTPNKHSSERDKKLGRLETTCVRKLAGLAKRATQAVEQGDAEAWRERAQRAWRRIVELEPDHEKAHRALGSEKVDGRWVLRRWVPVIRARVALREAGKARAKTAFETSGIAPDPRLARAGITAHGARCGQFVAQTRYGPAVAQALAVWCRRAAVEMAEVHGLPDPPVQGTDYVVLSLQNADEWQKVLVSGFAWTPEKAKEEVEEGTLGLWPNNNVWLLHKREDHGGTHSIDSSIQSVVRWAVRMESFMQGDDRSIRPESWFGEALALDVVYRLTGQAISMFVADQGYRDAMRDSPEMNRWQAIARLSVERDDDVPLRVLVRMGLNQLKTRHTAKAYTFLQFLRERDADEAKAFVRAVIRGNTPRAIEEVYGRSMESLDQEYAEWIRGTYPLTGF